MQCVWLHKRNMNVRAGINSVAHNPLAGMLERDKATCLRGRNKT